MKKIMYLESKPRYMALDGLRGVAAMMVVAFHLFEYYSGGHIHQIINHGYLAVDFFFVLSGFVVGYAYDDRWGKMSFGAFVKRRLVRLHPMLIMGSLIGGLLYYFGGCEAFSIVNTTEWYVVMLVMLLGCFLIPVKGGLDIRGWAEGYPLNGPAWTLAFEYVANLLYALVFRRLGKIALGVCVAVFAAMTVMLTLNIDVFGLLARRADLAYTVIGGWSLAPEQLYVGFSRLLYPFFAGLLLSRLGRFINMKNGFVWCSLVIVVLLSMPFVGSESMQWTNGLYEAFCILIMFPLIVLAGATDRVPNRHIRKACEFLGEISFPLYITHYPLIYIQMAWANEHADAPISTHVFVSVALFVVAIALAYACSRLYDIPVRKWLERALKNKLLAK